MLRSRLTLSVPSAVRALSTSAAPAASVPRVTRTAATAKANIQPATQSASLASGVLLGTQRNWKTETVVTLKAELKRRGLSQQGNKSALVSRLEAAEASASLVPPTPIVAPASPSRPRSRSVSSSAPLAAAPSAPVAAAPTPVPRFPTAEEVVTTAAGDRDVETPHLAKPVPVTKATRVSAPGLPIKPNTVAQAFFDIKFPDPTPIRPIPQVIPTVPDNFSVSKRSTPSLKETTPRVVTVASAATHPAGGPVSPDLPVADSYALEWDDPSALTIDKSSFAQVENAVSAATEAVSNLVDINLPPAPSEKDTKYVANTEPLNHDERRGAWVLAAGVAAVLLLGGVVNKVSPPKTKESKAEEKKTETKAEKKD